MDRGLNGNVAADGTRGEGGRLRALLHVNVVVRSRNRAHLHVYPGAKPVEDVRAAGGEAPEGPAVEGCDCARVLQELPLQPPRQGGARRPAGVSVPAGERRPAAWS